VCRKVVFFTLADDYITIFFISIFWWKAFVDLSGVATYA
jgi:hypothetical protein